MKYVVKFLCNLINYGFFGVVVAAISFIAGMTVDVIMTTNPEKDYGYFTACCKMRDGSNVAVKKAETICKCDKIKTK